MFERLSLHDESLLAGYAESIQRHEFALEWCSGRRVLDAGCGSGYGSFYLAAHGAQSVLGVDVSTQAIAEAKHHYDRANLEFMTHDLTALGTLERSLDFHVVTHFETLPHLHDAGAFLRGVTAVLAEGGTFICSIPNGSIVPTDSAGSPLYRYQHRTYDAEELRSLLLQHFASLTLFGHWLTHQGVLRRHRARELFDQQMAAYYNPFCRLGRLLLRTAGKPVAPPPSYHGDADSYKGDYEIARIGNSDFSWPPTSLIAICKR